MQNQCEQSLTNDHFLFVLEYLKSQLFEMPVTKEIKVDPNYRKDQTSHFVESTTRKVSLVKSVLQQSCHLTHQTLTS